LVGGGPGPSRLVLKDRAHGKGRGAWVAPCRREAPGRHADTRADGSDANRWEQVGLPDCSSEAVANGPFFGQVSLNPPRDVAPAGRPRKLPFMNGDPNLAEATTRAALPRDARRDAWLEQRLSHLTVEQARLKAGPPLRRLLRGAVAAYHRFLLTAGPAHHFHCWVTIQAVSAGLDQLERSRAGHKDPGSTPDGPDPG
jgi:hypothetical protein